MAKPTSQDQNKTLDRIRQGLAPTLQPGEQLRVVAWFQSGGNWLELPKPTFFTIRNWSVGVTDKRVILAKESRMNGQLMPNEVYSVPRENASLGWWRGLKLASHDRKIPKRLRAIPWSGYNKDEFNQALHT